jgi:DNA-binding NarL/FixJ family response regulator
MTTPVRILVADDHEVVRHGLEDLLEAQQGWEVCAHASDGREAVDKAMQTTPSVAILDISMPSLNGLEAARQIRKAIPPTKVLILTMHESEELVREVADTGAHGYLLKSDAGRDLVAAIEAIRRNKPFFTCNAAKSATEYSGMDGRNAAGHPDSRDSLTPRQREVVQLLAEGKSSKEVAVTLDLSVKTAETHRANIMRKLDLHSISELVRYAVRNNIVQA